MHWSYLLCLVPFVGGALAISCVTHFGGDLSRETPIRNTRNNRVF